MMEQYSQQLDDMRASCRPNYGRRCAVVCPAVFTTNQNINIIHVTPSQYILRRCVLST